VRSQAAGGETDPPPIGKPTPTPTLPPPRCTPVPMPTEGPLR